MSSDNRRIWAGLLLAGLAAERPGANDAQGRLQAPSSASAPRSTQGNSPKQNAHGAALVKAQFNSITPENVLKWELVHPQPDAYDFEAVGPATSRSARRTACSSSATRSCGTARRRLGVPGRQGRQPLDARRAAEADARPHLYRRRPLQGPHQRLGRGERSPRTRTARCASRPG